MPRYKYAAHDPLFAFRLKAADRLNLEAVREHCRRDDVWANKTDAFRAALEIAANVIRSGKTTAPTVDF